MNRYLVVYEGGATSPWGQFISNTGTLVGARFDIGVGAFKGGMTGVDLELLDQGMVRHLGELLQPG